MTKSQFTELQSAFYCAYQELGLDGAIEAVAIAAIRQTYGGPILVAACTKGRSLELVAAAMGESASVIKERGRWRSVSHLRWIAMWLFRQSAAPWPRLSFPEIARELGLQNHTTVIHGVRKVEASQEMLARAMSILAATRPTDILEVSP